MGKERKPTRRRHGKVSQPRFASCVVQKKIKCGTIAAASAGVGVGAGAGAGAGAEAGAGKLDRKTEA